jgi:hypothetical protein
MLILIISYICGSLACWYGLDSEVHFSINLNSTLFPLTGLGILLPLKTLVRFSDPLESATCALLRVPLPKSIPEALWNHGIRHSLREHRGTIPFGIDGKTNCSLTQFWCNLNPFKINTYVRPHKC